VVVSDSANYVVCWSDDGKLRFDYFELGDWQSARDLFEERAALLASVCPLVNPPYGDLARRGGAVPPSRRIPVGIFRAHRIETHVAPDLFVCVGRAPRMLAILGPAAEVDRRTAALREQRVECRRYVQPSVDERNARPKPPSELAYSVGARHALDRVKADETQIGTVLVGLPVGELIWIGEQARKEDHAWVAGEVARLALRRSRTPGTLNLLGSVLRDRGELDRSIETFTESLDLCESAKLNPYGSIGLAASLRRCGRSDEAWDVLKGPLKHYPDDEYALNVRAALVRDHRVEDAA